NSSGRAPNLKDLFARLGDAELWFAHYYCRSGLKLDNSQCKAMEEILLQRGFTDLHRRRLPGMTPLLKHLEALSARAARRMREKPLSEDEELDRQYWKRVECRFYMKFPEFLIGQAPGEVSGDPQPREG